MKKTVKEIYKSNKKLLNKKEKEIMNNYIDGYKSLDKEIAKIYKNYADNDGKLYMKKMVKYDRIKKLELDVASIIGKIYRENNKLTKDLLENIADRSYSTITTKAEAKTGKKINTISKEVIISDEVNKLVAGINWKDRNNNHSMNMIYKAHGVIKDGLEEGKTYKTMAKQLEKLFGDDISNPMKVARTEGHRVMESSKLEAVKQIEKEGIKMTKTWTSMGDERVRSSHVEMDGTTINVKDKFELPSGVEASAPGLSGEPSEDINCRCILTYDIK